MPKPWGWLIPFVLLASLACNALSGVAPEAPKQAASGAGTPSGSPSGSQPQNTPSGAATSTGVPSPAPGGTAIPASLPGEVTVKQAITFGPGAFNLPDPRVGLSGLSSYTATLKTSFDGSSSGQPAKWSRTYVMLASKDPAARQLTITTSGDVSNLDPVFMAELDGADYERRGQNDCTAAAIQPGNSLSDQLEPAGFLNFIVGAQDEGSQTVNNVPASHYSFDERALGQQNLTQSQGETWVADPGGYVVRYLLTTKAGADYFGPGIEGTLTLDYELTDVSKPISFQLPEGCPGGMINAPLLQGASNVVSVPGDLTYDTTASLADAVAFYQTHLPTLGWKLPNPPDIGQTDAALDFEQGDQSLTVSITTDANGTTVNLQLLRSQTP